MSKYSQSSAQKVLAAAAYLDHLGRTPLERDLRAVADLIEVGMNLARVIRQRVESGDHEAIAKYPFVADAVVRAIALQAALRSQLPERPSTPVQKPPAIAAEEPGRARRRKEQVKSLVEGAIKDNGGGRRTVERRLLKLDEWLEDPALDAHLAKRATGQIAADMCRQLGIAPDISGWPQDALWEEARRNAKMRGQH